MPDLRGPPITRHHRKVCKSPHIPRYGSVSVCLFSSTSPELHVRASPNCCALAVVFFSRPRFDGWPHHLSLSSVIPIDSSTGSPVHALMLSVRAWWSSSPACTWHCSLRYRFLAALSRPEMPPWPPAATPKSGPLHSRLLGDCDTVRGTQWLK